MSINRDDHEQVDALENPLDVWFGACGVMHCDDCLPRFDAENNEIPAREAEDFENYTS